MKQEAHTLGDLRIGESGYVKNVDADNVRRRRIVDMGITPGTHMRIVKAAPMGDPIEVSLRDIRCPCAGKMPEVYLCFQMRKQRK